MMLFGLLIDFICRLILVALAVGVVFFVIVMAVLMIGEKMNWW